MNGWRVEWKSSFRDSVVDHSRNKVVVWDIVCDELEWNPAEKDLKRRNCTMGEFTSYRQRFLTCRILRFRTNYPRDRETG